MTGHARLATASGPAVAGRTAENADFGILVAAQHIALVVLQPYAYRPEPFQTKVNFSIVEWLPERDKLAAVPAASAASSESAISASIIWPARSIRNGSFSVVMRFSSTSTGLPESGRSRKPMVSDRHAAGRCTRRSCRRADAKPYLWRASDGRSIHKPLVMRLLGTSSAWSQSGQSRTMRSLA